MPPEEWNFIYDPDMGSLKYVRSQPKSEVLCVAYILGHEITLDDLKYVRVIDKGRMVRFVCSESWSDCEKQGWLYKG
jgi:hypothetical protein